MIKKIVILLIKKMRSELVPGQQKTRFVQTIEKTGLSHLLSFLLSILEPKKEKVWQKQPSNMK